MPTASREQDLPAGQSSGDQSLPAESYKGQTYWADLPLSERTRWVWQQQLAEEQKELSTVWQIFKEDPLQPFVLYWKRNVIPGMGIFIAGYVLFSITNIHTLFQDAYQPCWGMFTDCSKVWTQTTDYFQVVGIILGQISVGLLSDWLGRRWGVIQDAVVMFLGAVMLACSTGATANGWVIMYAVAQLVFGVGVGGEYPMTGSAVAEKEVPGSRADRLHRGRNVVLAFTMQGWGQLINLGVLMVGLLAFNSKGSGPYSHGAAGATFRFSFGAVAVLILWLAYYRTWRMKAVNNSWKAAKQKSKASGFDNKSLALLLRHFWHRLLGTGVGWFCNDFIFYGNATFRITFISVLVGPDASVMTSWLWNLLNVGVALVGYHAAAFTIDWKSWGRVRMQATGFLACFILFLLPACLWGTLTGSKSGIKVFQFLYFFSSFWNQFGPNCTTFLVAAEVYPTSVRATAHGLSAATGKIGALLPTVIFNYIGNSTKFWVVCWAGLLGFLVTVLFVPDLTGLDLLEQEKRWAFMQQGRMHDYHGVAVHPRHLSLWEKWVLGLHKGYRPNAHLEGTNAENTMQAHNTEATLNC